MGNHHFQTQHSLMACKKSLMEFFVSLTFFPLDLTQKSFAVLLVLAYFSLKLFLTPSQSFQKDQNFILIQPFLVFILFYGLDLHFSFVCFSFYLEKFALTHQFYEPFYSSQIPLAIEVLAIV